MLRKPKKHKPAVSASHLDQLWRKAIRNKWDNKCALCGYPQGESHHVIKRRHVLLKWDLRNGMLLCARHHQEAETLQGKIKVLAKMDKQELEEITELEKYTLKDWLTAHRMTSDEFRVFARDRLKAYLADGED